MKKWLSFLGAITLLGTSTTSLVACNNIPQYNEDELQQLKKENQIYTNCQEIKENLEWICPQEQPFNTVDNKWYYVVWRGEENEEWKITKFQNKNKNNRHYEIDIKERINFVSSLMNVRNDLLITDTPSRVVSTKYWNDDNGKYFKAVYRWNGEEQKLPNLDIDKDGNIKVNGE
ncbi:lipoprotein [Spiroplasma citri]|uniref:lipoprotein n=1 Tax=Spiroplasma citri TaxID=2133 RepID=UPI0024126825|nr:lipoprotein [Spiroplasma citri]WFG98111.1 lipoprotein [Spiroplasma citri]